MMAGMPLGGRGRGPRGPGSGGHSAGRGYEDAAITGPPSVAVARVVAGWLPGTGSLSWSSRPRGTWEHRTQNVQFWSIITAARQPLPDHLSACSIAGLSLATGPPRRSAGMPAVASTGWRCSLRRSCLTPVVGRCDSRARAITRGWAPSARLTPDSRSVRGRWGRFLGWAGLDSYGHLVLAGSCRPGQAVTDSRRGGASTSLRGGPGWTLPRPV
jgi:hypothetical protein